MNDYGRTDLKKLLKQIRSFVEDSQLPGKKLFVHCQSGQNRSATVVIAILMTLGNQPMTLLDAYSYVKTRRQMVQINEKYAKQLSDLEYELFGKITVPKDWMKIRSADFNTGKVTFCGQGITQRLSPQKARAQKLAVKDKRSFGQTHDVNQSSLEALRKGLTGLTALATEDYSFRSSVGTIQIEHSLGSDIAEEEIKTLREGQETTLNEDELFSNVKEDIEICYTEPRRG